MKEILSAYQENYTNQIWDHFCIVITKWENSRKGKNIRKKKGITDEGVRE